MRDHGRARGARRPGCGACVIASRAGAVRLGRGGRPGPPGTGDAMDDMDLSDGPACDEKTARERVLGRRWRTRERRHRWRYGDMAGRYLWAIRIRAPRPGPVADLKTKRKAVVADRVGRMPAPLAGVVTGW